jgi:hypothetical protein
LDTPVAVQPFHDAPPLVSTVAAIAEPATTTAAIEAIIEEVRILNILGHCPC